MESLEEALTANRAAVERELAKAQLELEDLRARERVLESTISRALYVLGVGGPPPRAMQGNAGSGGERVPLHEALVRILRALGNSPMTARELADEVNRTGLYRKGDGAPVDVGQVHARVHAYQRLFVREGGRIRLREAELQVHDPLVLARFDAAMLEVYDAAMREIGYAARRFLQMTRRSGGLDAARHLLAKPGVSEGFRRLAEAGKLTITIEYQVLRPEFVPLFTEEERDIARQRLLAHGFSERELPRR